MKAFPWKTLLDWYENNGRQSLPWRDYRFSEKELPYRVWISEIFLQQTQAERVKIYFEKVIEKYPNIELLAQSSYEEFFEYYRWLGYYSRARNILKTAKIITEKYSMIFPTSEKELINLPGIWEYTAEAIKAFWYGIPTLSWDTNLEKVFARYFFWNRFRRLNKEEKDDVWKNLLLYIEENSRWDVESMKKLTRSVNNALMDFSSMIDKNEVGKIEWENYIFKESVFYVSKWELEPLKEKKSSTFPTPDATIKIILHKDHKIYYSENKNFYEPLSLDPWLTRDTRKYVQDVFREKYGLEVSVRPIHKKWFSHDEKPFIEVNVQIQKGEYNFTEYTKKDKKFSEENKN
mgnify:CR=1 FL=1